MSYKVGNNEENSVLLAYTVPYCRRFVLSIVFFMLLWGIGLLVRLLYHRSLGESLLLSLVYPVVYLSMIMLFGMHRIVIELTCIASGLVLKGFRGKNYNISWDQIRKLKVSRHPYLKYGYLSMMDKKQLSLTLIPAEVQQKLASLIRERGLAQTFEIEG